MNISKPLCVVLCGMLLGFQGHMVVAMFDMCTNFYGFCFLATPPPPAYSDSRVGHSNFYPVLPCHGGVAGLCSLQGNIKRSPSSSQPQPNAGYPTLRVGAALFTGAQQCTTHHGRL
jgi:hypothetical protein